MVWWPRSRVARTVDPAEHAAHLLQVAVVQEPDGMVVLVLLEGHCGGAGRCEPTDLGTATSDLANEKRTCLGLLGLTKKRLGLNIKHRFRVRTHLRTSWSHPGGPCGARLGARPTRACPRSHPVFL